MHRIYARLLVALGAVITLAGAAVVPAVAGAQARTGTTAGTRGLAALPAARGSLQTMIVLLRTHDALADTAGARAAAARAVEAPVTARLKAAGASVSATTTVPAAVIARMTSAQAAALAGEASVEAVLPNSSIPGPARPQSMTELVDAAAASATSTRSKPAVSPPPCGTVGNPELDPEALQNINAPAAFSMGIDGAGVKVAFLAGGIDPKNADLQRSPAWASSSSPPGSPVISSYKSFSGDGPYAPSGDAAVESWGDASSIASQGNVAYDLSKFVSTAHPLPKGCDIQIVGAAPGATLEALEIFATSNTTTLSGFLQAIDYAVKTGVKVINESFGGNNFPDSSLDATKLADDAAVAAGVTVVASSGDAGVTGTTGSPSTDPNVISVGASTTFRSYEQEAFGGINNPTGNGSYVDDNISSLSSGGVAQNGSTIDLVAPGDLNWALCSTNTAQFPAPDCENWSSKPSSIQAFGGTSEAAPLTAAGAADVIQAYLQTHGGAYPTPAQVKRILMSTARDIDAPADEQGAGILDIAAAVRLAESLPSSTAPANGGAIVSPNQIDVVSQPGAASSNTISITNTNSTPLSLQLSTRALTESVGKPVGGSFCMQPSTPTSTCPANTGVFPIWSGIHEVYQLVPFSVPAGQPGATTRLEFTADYQDSSQTSLLHVALVEPNGAYAAYSLAQGLGDFARVEVANPPAGVWTAVFFTEQNGATPGGIGTSGTIQWRSSELQFAPEGTVTPSSLTVAPGQTATAVLHVTAPTAAGDTSQSVVISALGGGSTTIPVVVRTMVPTTTSGGTVSGVLTGGNGRGGAPAQENTYYFDAYVGTPDIAVTVALAKNPKGNVLPGDQVNAFLIDPHGDAVGYSSNYTASAGGVPKVVPDVSVFHANPVPGQWALVLQWANPVTGLALGTPFTGTINFGSVTATSTLPDSATTVVPLGVNTNYKVNFCNPSKAPQAFFADARNPTQEDITLPNQNGPSSMSLPVFSPPYYFVPPETTTLQETVFANIPVTFDSSYAPGDPDISPVEKAPGVSGFQRGGQASVVLTEPVVSQGIWFVVPAEIGPYPKAGERAGAADVTVSVLTKTFDPNETSSTGDIWESLNGQSSAKFSPVYLNGSACGSITVSFNPNFNEAGQVISGTLYVDDYVLGSNFSSLTQIVPGGDEVIAIPYEYKAG